MPEWNFKDLVNHKIPEKFFNVLDFKTLSALLSWVYGVTKVKRPIMYRPFFEVSHQPGSCIPVISILQQIKQKALRQVCIIVIRYGHHWGSLMKPQSRHRFKMFCMILIHL
jgi:hypothetical protein